jgi:hypothetical protein
MKKILSISSITLGLFLVTSPFILVCGQNKSEEPILEKQNQTADLRQKLAKSQVGTILFDMISTRQSKWIVSKSGYIARDDGNRMTYVDLLVSKGKLFLGISISEYDSPDDANEAFSGPREYGANVPFSAYGDRGDKLIGERGDFMAVRFRQGNFFVYISCRDEKATERFARYALAAIKEVTKK